MESLTFPTLGSPRRFNFTQAYYESENPSTASSPFVSAPSSPGRNGPTGFYFSAPTSPSWARKIEIHETISSTRKEWIDVAPFSWDEQQGTPKMEDADGREEANSPLSIASSDFEFSARFSEMEEPPMSPTPMSSANELFFNGRIRPLRSPPQLQQPPSVRQLMAAELKKESSFNLRSSAGYSVSAPQSPRSGLKQGWLNLNKGGSRGIANQADKALDPFTVAMEQMTKRDSDNEHQRARFLSPSKPSYWDEHPSRPSERQEFPRVIPEESKVDEEEAHKDSRRSSAKTSKRWTLKDLFHRSWGEGRSHSRGSSRRSSVGTPLRHKSQSMRGVGKSEGSQHSTGSSPPERDGGRGSADEGKPARTLAANGTALRIKLPQRSPGGAVSAHELYAKQKAQAEELRNKTFLPYRQGLLGCLGFNSRSYRTMTNISKTLQTVS